MIELSDVSLRLGDFALKDISLKAPEGSYTVVLGPTGAGKTILLETIAGFHTPERGRVLISGRDVTHIPPERRGVGMVYQDYKLFPNMSVEENIAFGLRVRGVRGNDLRSRVRDAAHRLDISHLLRRRPHTLSGGEMQRVSLARALVTDPEVLLLDEPMSAVDPEHASRARELLRQIHREGTPVLHVTHSQEEAFSMATWLVLMKDGMIADQGEPEDVFRKPQSAFAAGFFGGNVLRGELRNGAFVSGGIEIQTISELTGPCVAVVRPEDIVLSRERVRTSARNILEGVVREVTDMATRHCVTVLVDDVEFRTYITRESCTELGVQPGKRVFLHFKANQVHVIPT